MHERLHESIKRFIEDGTIRLIEKPIDITRFEYDEVIYKHMSEEQSLDFEKLLEIYTTQRQWRDFKSNEEVIKFLNLSQDENKKNINDLNANEFPVSHLKLIGTNTNINVKSNKIVSVKNAKFNISG